MYRPDTVMIYSMTAFAAASGHFNAGILSLEVRSVNHRYLEMSLKLPEGLRSIEPTIRNAVKSAVSRGKLDINLRLSRDHSTGQSSLMLNESLATALSDLSDKAASLFPNAEPARLSDWLQWPGLVDEPALDIDALSEAVATLMHTALTSLKAMRQREGQQLEGMIRERLTEVSALADEVTGLLPELRILAQQRLQEKVEQLTTRIDPDRLEQELAMLLQKMDIAEEIDRLGAHVREVERTLVQDKPVGRRLDFLMQELHREANTLGSKSVDARTSRISVDLKVLIEQMREQVQNIE